MSATARLWMVALTLLMVHASDPARAESTVLLKTAWLKKHKNRVTITADCRIEKSHDRPNAAKKDGDLHMACRCKGIDLSMVAEIMNAAKFGAAVSAAKDAATTKDVTRLTGVWRFWLEHPSSQPETQGGPVPVPVNTNPDHSFELHPLTEFGGIDLSASLGPIQGFKPYAAKKAFSYYEKRDFNVARTGSFTSIEGTKAMYNYASFGFTVAGKPKKVADGWFVLATIDGVPSEPRRMVVAAGTPPAVLVAKAKKGMRYSAVGVPRINLERIDDAIAQHPGEEITVSGAYEMIIVSLAKKP